MSLAPAADEPDGAPSEAAPARRDRVREAAVPGRPRGSWRRGMSLRLRINLLITALMAVFAVAVGRMVIDDARSSIREEIEAGTKVTVQMLSAALFASQVTDSPRRFVQAFLERLGRVRANHLRLRDSVSGEVVYESPPSVYKAGRAAPGWYARLVDPHIAPVNLQLPGARIEIVPDASRATLDAWDDLTHLVALGGLFFVLVNALVFGFVSRALRPMQQIRHALAQMEAGQVEAQLPDFALPELHGIGVAFNRMTVALREAMHENRRLAVAEAELTRNREVARLVRERIEEERRGIAQELHDELSQCVTAIRTIAESLIRRPAADTGEVRAAAQRIKDIAARIYDGMHAIVRRLRPPELDVLGLAETLRATVAAWRERNPGMRFELAVQGDLDALGPAVDIVVYRVVHEALTNVVRHARASAVHVRVARDGGSVQVRVRDDGHGQVTLGAPVLGLGLVGMRERVEALGGRFEVDGRPGAGTEVRATLPVTGG